MKTVMIGALVLAFALVVAQAADSPPTMSPTMQTDYDTNFIQNGNFDQGTEAAILPPKQVNGDQILSWSITAQSAGGSPSTLYHGKANELYNLWPQSSTNNAIKLRSNLGQGPVSISQNIMIEVCSYYRLKFQYAFPRLSSLLKVKFNDKQIATVPQEDTNVDTYNVIIKVEKQESKIEFIIESTDTGLGVITIDNIGLYKVSEA